MNTEVKQRVCGLLGGVAYVSTTEYYNLMNQLVAKYLPGHGSRIHIVSLDVLPYVELLNNNQESEVIAYLLDGVHRLVKSGIDFLLICSNTSHIAAQRIMECYPNLVLIHIGDAIAFAIKQMKLKKIGFLGTKFAMLPNSRVVERLVQHGLEVVFPPKDDIERLHQIIIDELTYNIFTEESKQVYIDVMKRLYDEHKVEGIVLGCTEIPLLVKQSDLPDIPLFDSTRLHVELAVDYQVGRYDIDSFLPAQINNKNE